MNKRIIKLYEQAQDEIVDSDCADYYERIQLKFAELIVRECRKVIIDDMDSNPDDEAFNDALDHAQSIIGEHFGVEE